MNLYQAINIHSNANRIHEVIKDVRGQHGDMIRLPLPNPTVTLGTMAALLITESCHLIEEFNLLSSEDLNQFYSLATKARDNWNNSLKQGRAETNIINSIRRKTG
jgi:hypothetical protein